MLSQTLRFVLSGTAFVSMILSIPAYSQNQNNQNNQNQNNQNQNNQNQNPPPEPLNVNCRLTVNNNLTDLRGIVRHENLPKVVKDGKVEVVDRGQRFEDFYEIGVRCKANKDASLRGTFQLSNVPLCTQASSGFCLEDYHDKYKVESRNFSLDEDKEKKIQSLQILIYNKGGGAGTLARDQVKVAVRTQGPNSEEFTDRLTKNIVVEKATVAPSCRVIVSGAVDPTIPQTEGSLIEVSNGVLQFRSVIENASGADAKIKSVQWSGGPDQSGRWENAPTDAVSRVTARVTSWGSNNSMQCSLQVRPRGKGYNVKINKFGDCQYFTELRNYYFLDPTNREFQEAGYNPPIRYAGISAQYGVTAPEVPFRGLINGAASINGQIVIGLNGVVTIPPVSQRQFSRAVIVAKKFDAATSAVSSEPVYWGLIDYSDYSNTQLVPVPGASESKDDDTVVFQVYLAGAHISAANPNVDLRGQEGGLPYYNFIPVSQSGEVPLDRIVPFMNDSCIPLFQLAPPVRADKEMSTVLQSAISCSYSRPYTMADLKAGRVDLTALHITPEHALHEFPTDLLKASAQPPCVASNPSDVAECWDVKASQVGQSTSSDPYTTHDQCRTVTKLDKKQTYCNKYGCKEIVTPTVQVEYKSSCNVIEPTSECGANLAIRFSGYSQMLGAALGCAVKYNRSGEVVTPTLLNQGIFPYTSFGGSAPKDYRQYPSNQVSRENNVNMGFACIPCRFGSIETAAGRDIFATTAPLPVDQDASTPRKPIFTFNKLSAPRECVRNIQFEVRYFGSAACNGVANQGGVAKGTPVQSATNPNGQSSGSSIQGEERGIVRDSLSSGKTTGARRAVGTGDGSASSSSTTVLNEDLRRTRGGSTTTTTTTTGSATQTTSVGLPGGGANLSNDGHFCTSENVATQNCTAQDGMGGGNIAGKFTVPVCPGSGFEYDSVSVSWSPIIVDVLGNGISISRSFEHSVMFDIKGTGNKVRVDWPVNVREVAFLVRKNAKGTVESIKELFGDYKAKNGFEALRAFDSNKDRYIDSKDKKFGDLALWFDYNRNAVADEGEIVSLDEVGVESISLAYKKPLTKGIEGKTLSAVYFNGKEKRFMNIEDHYFYEYLQNGKRIGKK